MVPDQDDCRKLLGGPRGLRYVAQENLAPLSNPSEADLSHELLPSFFQHFHGPSSSFAPVEQLRYLYSADSADQLAAPLLPSTLAATQRTATTLRSVETLLRTHVIDAAKNGLLEPLLTLMRSARTVRDASVAERAAAAVLLAHPDPDITFQLQAADRALEAGDIDAAEQLLDDILAVDATYAHAWSRRAAVHLRVGAHERALEDTSTALHLQPSHFGALALRGSALAGLRRYKAAIEVLEAALELNPWATGLVTEIHQLSSKQKASAGSAKRYFSKKPQAKPSELKEAGEQSPGSAKR